MDIIFENSSRIVTKAGGGMLNTAVSLGRCGIDVSLISELGDDQTASMILSFLKANKINSKYIRKYYRQKTSIALAYLNEQKIPSFSIYKSYPDWRRLIYPESFSDKDILFYGSLYSLSSSIRTDVKTILAAAKQGKAIRCYDPNIRQHNLDEPGLRNALDENIAFADVVKGSDEDFKNIYGENTGDQYYSEIQKINPEVVFVFTKGAGGVTGYFNDICIDLPAQDINVVSTIGAGDAFNAGIVYYLERLKDKGLKLEKIGGEELKEMLNTGLQFSAAVCETMDNYVPNNFL
jgi:fructokinase